MKIIHIVPSIVEEASGPTYSVRRQSETLRENGHDVYLSSLADKDQKIQQNKSNYTFKRAKYLYKLGISNNLKYWLINQCKYSNVALMHGHGMWMMPNVYPSIASRESNVPLIHSPRGTLSEWSLEYHKIRKQIFWRLIQLKAMKQVSCFQATSYEEYLDIRKAGFKQPVYIIPNGIDIPKFDKPKSSTKFKKLLFLGRLHKKKGIEILLESWKILQDKFPNWELYIAGLAEDNYEEYLKKYSESLLLKRVFFKGPVYGHEKIKLYRDASLFVLPTFSENFANTVSESLACGTPVITTKGAPWSGLIDNACGWWIDIGLDSLVSCLNNALRIPGKELNKMGSNGIDWMKKDFSWDKISLKTLEVYKYLTHNQPPPHYLWFD
tara:strand:+ start:4991 stop:6133 length:1143 start_codon:yes stop_codon:yes gene_type:complete